MRPEIWLFGGLALIVLIYFANRPPYRLEMSSQEYWLKRQRQSREDYLND